MPLRFQCPACGKELQAPYAAAGLEGACTFCHARLIAPLADGQPARLPHQPAAPPPAAPPPPPMSQNPSMPDVGAEVWRPPATTPGAPHASPPTPGPAMPGFPTAAPASLPYAPFWKRAVEFGVDYLLLYLLYRMVSPLVNAVNPWPEPSLTKLLSALSGMAHPTGMGGAGGAGGDLGVGGLGTGGLGGLGTYDPTQGIDAFNPLTMILSGLVGAVVFGILEWLYFATLESSPWQATLGKLLVGVKVTDLQGQRISFWRATGRTMAKGLSRVMCFIGYLTAAFNDRIQALHDIIAQTVVINR